MFVCLFNTSRRLAYGFCGRQSSFFNNFAERSPRLRLAQQVEELKAKGDTDAMIEPGCSRKKHVVVVVVVVVVVCFLSSFGSVVGL